MISKYLGKDLDIDQTSKSASLDTFMHNLAFSLATKINPIAHPCHKDRRLSDLGLCSRRSPKFIALPSLLLPPTLHNTMTQPSSFSPLKITIGVLALQGAFSEHIQLLRESTTKRDEKIQWTFIEVRTPTELDRCDGLIIPGGESTTISLVAARSGMLEPLRQYVKYVLSPKPSTNPQPFHQASSLHIYKHKQILDRTELI